MSVENKAQRGFNILDEIQVRYRTPDRFGATCVGRFGYVEGLDRERNKRTLELNRIKRLDEEGQLKMHQALADAIGISVEEFRDALLDEKREIDAEYAQGLKASPQLS